jgi:uncharacterized protein YggT (Ycf19 family)
VYPGAANADVIKLALLTVTVSVRAVEPCKQMITINVLQVCNKMLEPFLRARPCMQLPAVQIMVVVVVVVVVVEAVLAA